ncbi:MAG: hypothetical protein H6751_00725 [Candidatus Omnitrophica bacterium]|nr:hypothetical protein [Candidatus Omnitrophota bacterium]
MIRIVRPKTESRSERGSCWTWSLIILFALTAVGALLFYWFTRAALVNQVKKQMSAEEYANMQEWLDSSLVFPEHWANPKPFSQNLKEIAEEIRPTVESWKANDEKRGAVRYSLIRSLRLDDQAHRDGTGPNPRTKG